MAGFFYPAYEHEPTILNVPDASLALDTVALQVDIPVPLSLVVNDIVPLLVIVGLNDDLL